MKSYHFDVGNSADGPVGYCARILAASEEEAVSRLRAFLEMKYEGIKVFDSVEDDGDPPSPGIEYLRVYVNPNALSTNQIDEINPVDDDDLEKASPSG